MLHNTSTRIDKYFCCRLCSALDRTVGVNAAIHTFTIITDGSIIIHSAIQVCPPQRRCAVRCRANIRQLCFDVLLKIDAADVMPRSDPRRIHLVSVRSRQRGRWRRGAGGTEGRCRRTRAGSAASATRTSPCARITAPFAAVAWLRCAMGLALRPVVRLRTRGGQAAL